MLAGLKSDPTVSGIVAVEQHRCMGNAVRAEFTHRHQLDTQSAVRNVGLQVVPSGVTPRTQRVSNQIDHRRRWLSECDGMRGGDFAKHFLGIARYWVSDGRNHAL